MLAFIAAFAATCYATTVTFFGVFTVTALDKQLTLKVCGPGTPLYAFRVIVETFSSAIAEIPLHLLVFKIVILQLTKLFGGFNYTIPYLLFVVDLVNMGALVMLFVESMREVIVVEEAIKDLTGGEPGDPVDHFLSLNHVNQLTNPIWTPSDITIYPNITYATNEETAEAISLTNDYDQPRKMMLDVYTTKQQQQNNNGKLRPVMVHIHGGSWRMGSKDLLYPYEKMLLTKDNWVIVNVGYRLAPKNPYPTHLCDVKRALRWIKRCISSFGGDPNFIVVAGDSSGGHVAAMVALSANDPRYQPGFEDVDTSVQGVLSLNGVLDIQSDSSRVNFFTHKVAMQEKVDPQFLREHSPLEQLQPAKERGTLVPFLIVSGNRDGIVDSSVADRFKAAYDKVSGGKSPACTHLQLPAAHHICHASWSPRSFYLANMIQVWCQQLYANGKK